MKICFVLIIFITLSLRGACQFPPAAGVEGSTAIHADSSIIIDWAKQCYIERGYIDIATPDSGFASYGNTQDAIGKADNQVVSLGDRGQAVLIFNPPICDKNGFDFAVFENGFSDNFLELAFVEISSDSIHWFRFPSISLTPTDQQIEPFGTLQTEKINNLAGKYSVLYGTPFDISEIEDDINLNKNNIRFIKVIDVAGTIDSTYASFDSQGHIINDPYPTPFYTCGFDLDAVGVLHCCSDNIESGFISNVKIYPNPVSRILQIESQQNIDKITIFDNCGKKILEDLGKNQVDVSFLKSGLYSVLIQTKNTIIKNIFVKD